MFCIFSFESNEEDVNDQSKSSLVHPVEQQESGGKPTAVNPKGTEDTMDGETTGENKSGRQMTGESKNEPQRQTNRTSPPTSPRRKVQITSLDQVLKLLQEKQLQQQLQNKEESASKRARMKWQHSMLVVLRKNRSITATPESSPSAAVVRESESVAAPELDQKTARLKYREISEKYDHILEDGKLKMLRRCTLLKKRRNSLILRKEILEKKLTKCREITKTPLKKRQSKDAKEMALYRKGDGDEVEKQLEVVRKELGGVEQNIETNLKDQDKLSSELNDKKQKELHEIRVNADMSQLTSKPNEQGQKLHRRQVSDTTLTTSGRSSEDGRGRTSRDDMDKPRLTQSLSSPSGDHRSKAKSFSAPRLPKAPSSPMLRTKTLDPSCGVERPAMKSRASQLALSAALSEIEVR